MGFCWRGDIYELMNAASYSVLAMLLNKTRERSIIHLGILEGLSLKFPQRKPPDMILTSGRTKKVLSASPKCHHCHINILRGNSNFINVSSNFHMRRSCLERVVSWWFSSFGGHHNRCKCGYSCKPNIPYSLWSTEVSGNWIYVELTPLSFSNSTYSFSLNEFFPV